MPISRLRIRLAGIYTLGFFVCLMAVSAGLYFYLLRRADRRLTAELESEAAQLDAAIKREMVENPRMTELTAVTDALTEWPDRKARLLLVDSLGGVIAASRAAAADVLMVEALAAARSGTFDTVSKDGAGVRLHISRRRTLPRGRPVAVASTDALLEDAGAVLRWLLLSAPAVLLASMGGGYLFSKLALAPLGRLADSTKSLDPNDLTQRLPVTTPADEIDRLALQINGFLQRIEQAQRENRRFLAQAAHQLKTPLTLVMGESALSLERERSGEEYRDALRRVQTASSQMARRVDELLLLARARAGEQLQVTELVELDGLILETARLMSTRALALGRVLKFGRIETVCVQGAEWLLREAMLELIENACRHGTAEHAVRVEVFPDGDNAVVQVENGSLAAPAIPPDWAASSSPESSNDGLGLSVLSWIARAHRGRLLVRREGEDLVVTSLELPVAPSSLKLDRL